MFLYQQKQFDLLLQCFVSVEGGGLDDPFDLFHTSIISPAKSSETVLNQLRVDVVLGHTVFEICQLIFHEKTVIRTKILLVTQKAHVREEDLKVINILVVIQQLYNLPVAIDLG